MIIEILKYSLIFSCLLLMFMRFVFFLYLVRSERDLRLSVIHMFTQQLPQIN